MHLRKNSSDSSDSGENITTQLIILILFILSPKTLIKRKSLKIVNNFILTKRIFLIKHISSNFFTHKWILQPNVSFKKQKNSSNNINNFVIVPINH